MKLPYNGFRDIVPVTRIANVPLIGRTIGDVLEEAAVEFAANEALVSVFEERRFTYSEFLDEVNRVAGG